MAVDCVEYNVCGALVYVCCVIQKPLYICPPHFHQITHQCIFKSTGRGCAMKFVCLISLSFFLTLVRKRNMQDTHVQN